MSLVTIVLDDAPNIWYGMLRNKHKQDRLDKIEYLQHLKRAESPSNFLRRYPFPDPNDRYFILTAVAIAPMSITYASYELQNDNNFLKQVLEKNGEAAYYVRKFWNNYDFLLEAARFPGVLTKQVINMLPGRSRQALIGNVDLFMHVVERDGLLIRWANRIVKSNREVMLKAVSQNRQALKYACYSHLQDTEIILAACHSKESNPKGYGFREKSVLTYALSVAKNNLPFALMIVQNDPESAWCALKHFKQHREIVLAALKHHPRFCYRAIRRHYWFPNFREMILDLVGNWSNMLQYVWKMYGDDKEVVITALKYDPYSYYCVPQSLKYDRDVVELVVSRFPSIFSDAHVPYEIKFDKKVAMAAVGSDSNLLYILPQELQTDPEIYLEAAKNVTPKLLQDERFCHNRDFILKAVQHLKPTMFQYLPLEFQNDRQVVITCIEHQPMIFGELPSAFRDDAEILTLALKKPSNLYALQHASERLRNDSDMVLLR